MTAVAVSGATGLIGGHAARLLIDSGAQVRCLVRNPAKVSSLDGALIVEGDLSNREALARLVAGVDAAIVVSGDPEQETGLIEAAGAAKVRKVVKVSALGPGGEAPRAHAVGESALSAQEVDWTILRPNAFMQTLAGYLPRLISRDGVFSLPAGSAATAWIDARDIAACAVAAIAGGASRAVLTLTGPESLTMPQVAEAVGNTTGQTLRYEQLPPSEAASRLSEILGPAFGSFLEAHYRAVAAGSFAQVTDCVPQLLGRPAASLTSLITEDPSRWTRPPD